VIDLGTWRAIDFYRGFELKAHRFYRLFELELPDWMGCTLVRDIDFYRGFGLCHYDFYRGWRCEGYYVRFCLRAI